MAVVDDRDQRLDPLQVLGVLGHVLARGLQVGDEGDLLAELRVLGEEGVEGGEAAQHVLREVGAVDADDQVLAAALEHLALGLGDLRRLRPPAAAARRRSPAGRRGQGLPAGVADQAAS